MMMPVEPARSGSHIPAPTRMAESTNPPFSARRRLQLLIMLFAVITIVAGAKPTDRMEWWEGNIPIIAMLVILTVSYRWWPLSDLSYILLAMFLLMATLGSHYTYERSPIGAWLAAILGGGRNPYDRLVHLCVGLLVYLLPGLRKPSTHRPMPGPLVLPFASRHHPGSLSHLGNRGGILRNRHAPEPGLCRYRRSVRFSA